MKWPWYFLGHLQVHLQISGLGRVMGLFFHVHNSGYPTCRWICAGKKPKWICTSRLKEIINTATEFRSIDKTFLSYGERTRTLGASIQLHFENGTEWLNVLTNLCISMFTTRTQCFLIEDSTMADYTVCLLNLIVGPHSYSLPSSSSFLHLPESVVHFCGSFVAPLTVLVYIVQFFQTSGFTHSAHFMSQCCGASGNHQMKIIYFFPLCAVGPRHDGKSRPRWPKYI